METGFAQLARTRVMPSEALEDAGIKPLLVNARQVKQLRGRKTDVADSIWLARVCQFGLCSPSHVPPKLFRELRNMNRHRRKLVSQRSSVRNRVQKVIDLIREVYRSDREPLWFA